MRSLFCKATETNPHAGWGLLLRILTCDHGLGCLDLARPHHEAERESETCRRADRRGARGRDETRGGTSEKNFCKGIGQKNTGNAKRPNADGKRSCYLLEISRPEEFGGEEIAADLRGDALVVACLGRVPLCGLSISRGARDLS